MTAATLLWASGGRRTFVVAAVVSIVSMPLTAMWFLLLGGVVLIAGLVLAAVRNTAPPGPAGWLGLGLLVGPAIYVGLAVIH